MTRKSIRASSFRRAAGKQTPPSGYCRNTTARTSAPAARAASGRCPIPRRSATKYAGQDKINACSVILSGAMMFEELGWTDVAAAIIRGIEGAIASKRVTYDLARQLPGATEVSTSQFAECIIEHVR